MRQRADVIVEKSNWRKAKDEKKHDEKFISSGLWALSRHPKSVVSPPSLLPVPASRPR